MIRIAVDAMGGDNAPAEIVKGAVAAAYNRADLHIVLVGRAEAVNSHLGGDGPGNISVVDAPQVIENDDKPLLALRRKRQSSLVVCLEMLKDREVDGVVSAGNTGAFMAGASLLVGRIPGVGKPALAPVLPTADGRGMVAVDIGATMDPKPENLYQFAIMGALYYQTVFGQDNPRVGLLNVGVEPEKGNEVMRQTYQLLAQSQLNFVGNVEAREVMAGPCDVLICDGFVGNVLLKSMEGVALTIFTQLKEAVVAGGLKAKVGGLLLKPTLQKFKRQMDYSEHGGAPLLGINGVCIKCHGSADANTVKNSILKQACSLTEGQVISNISKLMEG